MTGLPPRRILRPPPPPPLLLAAALAAAALLARGFWLLGERLLQHGYGLARSRLEQQLGEVMGHPLQLGPLRGIGADGLSIGPSRLLPGPQDGSSVQVDGLRLGLDPLASLQRRAAVLELRLVGGRADFRPNAAGQFWVLGRLPPGGESPRLHVRIGVQRSGLVVVHGPGPGLRSQPLQIHGYVAIAPHEQSLQGRLGFAFPQSPGSLRLRFAGHWQREQWQLQLQPLGLSLASLQPYLPGRARLHGRLQGDLRLDLTPGRLRCAGELQLQQLRWWQPGLPAAIEAERLPLACRGQRLQLPASPWRLAGWRGRLAAQLGLDRRLTVRLWAEPPAAFAAGAGPLQAQLRGRWQQGGLQGSQLELWSGASRLVAAGRLAAASDLAGWWRLDPQDLPTARRLPAWLWSHPIGGRFRLQGPLGRPRLAVEARLGGRDPLLGAWQASLRWRQGLLRLERFEAPHLQARAELPLASRPGGGLRTGALNAWIDLRAFPLARLDALVGARLRGRIDARGWLRGPLPALATDLQLGLHAPGAGPLLLRESWRGRLRGAGGAAQLTLASLAPALPGRLEARLDRSWFPTRVELQRRGGTLRLVGDPRHYAWQAEALPLQGLELLIGRSHPPQPLNGALRGAGRLGLQPLAFDGHLDLREPLLFSLAGRKLQASLQYRNRRYRVQGSVQPLSGGSIGLSLQGAWAGPFQARFQARALSSLLFHQLGDAWDRWRGRAQPRRAGAADLGQPAIASLGFSVQDQLLVLQAVRERLQHQEEQQRQLSRAELLRRLQLRVDADLAIRGADLRRARVDLSARGHLWFDQSDRDVALARDPFTLRLQGPLVAGEGSFAASGLTLALLSLLTPVPESLRGFLSLQGRYRLGGGPPQLAMDLALDQTSLADRDLRLERGQLQLVPAGLSMDLALRAAGSSSTIDLSGLLPLQRDSQALQLRLSSRGDGLRFLTDLAGPAILWRRGSVDLRLLVRGSLDDPIANGFLRIRDGEYGFIGQSLRGVEATVLFDFQQLLVQELRARVGHEGRIRGEGRLGLLRPLDSEPSLTVQLDQVPFALERIRALADGQLRLGGSLAGPELGGSLAIRRGTINAQPGGLARLDSPSGSAAAGAGQGSGASAPRRGDPASGAMGLQPTSLNELLQRRWDFSQPLVLLGPDLESSTNLSLQEAIPRLPWLRFADLRLRLGPDLAVVLPNIANFRTGGLLRINGRLDRSLQASGVVRLLSGRLNLFTTTFSLDPDAPNVAVFTPSLGLVPYLDVALRTRIADNLQVISPSGIGALDFPQQTPGERQNQGFSSLSQLNLILVTVSASGPADRLADNLRLRSSPPLPQERLVALIGGNSLAGLRGGQAGTALATALGQSLLSPLLASLSDAMGQRVSLALYPTYVNPAIANSSERVSGRVPPQLVLAGEAGLDLTKRLNVSVLFAPNRSDIPPQMTLNYKASESINLGASLDTQGSWQSVLQVFLRF